MTDNTPAIVAPAAPLPDSQNPRAVYLASLAPGSLSAMRGALDTIARLLTGTPDDEPAPEIAWHLLRFQHTAAIRAKLASRYSANTANKMLVALRQVLKRCYLLELMSADDYQRAIQVEAVEGERLPAGRDLSAGEIGALLEACVVDPSPAGARDAAMLALLAAGGFRRAEVCALELADYDAASGQLKIRAGKRNKDRTTYAKNGAAKYLADWLELRGAAPGPIFCPVNKGGRVIVRRMHPEAVFNLLAKRGAEAGIVNLSPHDFRRTFAGDLLEAGVDISTVAKLMGHANVNTTARYDRRGEQAKVKAAGMLHVPYHKRKP